MKKRHPIATLVRLREIAERRARGDLGRANGEVLTAAEELARQRERLADGQPHEAEIPPAILLSMHLRNVATVENIEQAAEVLKRTEDHARRERRKWYFTAEELQAAEELHRRQRRENALKARTAADRVLDELVSARRKRGEE